VPSSRSSAHSLCDSDVGVARCALSIDASAQSRDGFGANSDGYAQSIDGYGVSTRCYDDRLRCFGRSIDGSAPSLDCHGWSTACSGCGFDCIERPCRTSASCSVGERGGAPGRVRTAQGTECLAFGSRQRRQRVARRARTVLERLHDDPHERERGTERVADRRPATARVPSIQALRRQTQTDDALVSAIERERRGRDLERRRCRRRIAAATSTM
jgi:hypothetical protein